MLQTMFDSTCVPVLEEVVGFAQARHTLLAGNIANLDTPGYQARDLEVGEFQERLKDAIERRKDPAATPPEAYGAPMGRGKNIGQIAKNSQAILRHDEGNVGMEFQVSEMAKNQMQHNMALQIMIQQFRLLQTAITGRL
ncbi:MAG: flagellar basal body rod protein FlgB [Planctomycetota bacterium]